MSDITVNNFKAFYEQIRPYLGAVHSGFTPIGTVISVMGTTAPMNYLACDGTVYNIADYTELAAYFNQQFGSSNFFGGNGTTTFAVPDLRGEFLRGTGTNSHANQGSGAAVGVHQDGTRHLTVGANPGNNRMYIYTDELLSDGVLNPDNIKDGQFDVSQEGLGNTRVLSNMGTYTSRPTSTSVLFCIASKNIFMDAGSNYSTEEQVVGTWIDGKPIYQKTWTGLSIAVPNNAWASDVLTIPNGDKLINIVMLFKDGGSMYVYTAKTSTIVSNKLSIIGLDARTISIITLQYTKTTDS